MKWCSLKFFKGVLYIHSPNPDDELKTLSRWSWSDECCFFSTAYFPTVFWRVSYTCSSSYGVCDRVCTYTHLSHACFAGAHTLCAYFTLLMRVTYTHGSHECHENGVCRMSVFVLHLIFSLLMTHLSLLFLDSHFETTPDCDLDDFTDDTIHKFFPYFPVLGAPLRTCIAKFSYLARSRALKTGCEPNKFDTNTSVDDDTTLINDPDHTSDFSNTTNENIRQFGVPTKKNSLFRTFLMMILILYRKQRKHAIGKPLQDREKEKEKVLRSVMQCRCQRMVNGTALVWVRRVTENSILKSLRKFHSDGWEIREHLQRRAQQAFFVNFHFIGN